jgi:Ca2+-binding EF-hand superfamily protein
MMIRLRLLTVAGLTCIATILVCLLATDSINNPLNLGLGTRGVAVLIVAGTALIADIVIIYIHAVQPPHPKFLLSWDHRLSIRAHAIAGSVETVLGIVAWITDSRSLAIATGFVALIQIAAAYYQTPGVFGMKGVAVPLYYAAISVHLFCAVNLIATGDIAWLERTWIILQTYAFVRIMYFLLGRTSAFRGSEYTIAVVLGGMITGPFVLGPIAPFFIVTIVALYLLLYWLIMRPSKAEWSALFVEHIRRTLAPRLQEGWRAMGISVPQGLSEREEAEFVFQQLDSDGSGTLNLVEMEPLLAGLGVSTRLQSCLLNHQQQSGDSTEVTFDTFFTTLWLPSRLEGSTGVPRETGLTDEQTGRIVFDFLDIHGRGYVDEIQIEILLLGWGMDLHEAQRTIRRISGPVQMQYSYDEFRTRLKPIWRYGYERLTTDAE